MKTVLVTGAKGFIGRHCLPLLTAKGYDVHAVNIVRSDDEAVPGIHWHVADLLNQDAVKSLLAKVQPTHLLHFSWHTEHGKYWTSLENFRWVQASLELLQAFAQNGGTRVVMAGSCAEYEWKFDRYSEQETPRVPATVYGTAKHALQLMLDSFSRQTGMSSAWGRIFHLYGPYEDPRRLVSSVICSLLQGKEAKCSHGRQLRDFLYVEDVARAFVEILDSELTGAVNIGSGKATSIHDIVEAIGSQIGRKELIQFGALPAPVNDPASLVADVRRLESIGWSPEWTMDDGLKETIRWWKMKSGTGAGK